MTVFAVNLALLYVSFVITSWYLQKYLKDVIDKAKAFRNISLLVMFMCHVFAFYSHFFLLHIASLFWKQTQE